MKNVGRLTFRLSVMTAAAFSLSIFSSSISASMAQEVAPSTASHLKDASLQQLYSQVRELSAVIEQMRTENAQSRAEMQELRQELQETRKLLAPLATSSTASGNPSSTAQTESTLYGAKSAASSESASCKCG